MISHTLDSNQKDIWELGKLSGEKDTKNKMIWLCLIAPIKPTIAIKRRKTPHAMTPPRAGSDTSIACFLPYAATPINIKPMN